MKNIVLAFLVLCANSDVFAHEIETHKRIGDAAVAYLQQIQQNQAKSGLSPRPLPLDSIKGLLQTTLQYGAKHEDDAYLWNVGINPYGRFIFHFTPALDNKLAGLFTDISANTCSSIGWSQSIGYPGGSPSASNGKAGCSVSCDSRLGYVEAACVLIDGNNHTNSFRWDQDLTAGSDGYPAVNSINGLGYVIHLLEDLGSPPHTRNDAHPCALGAFYCDQFEKFNDNEKYPKCGDPQILPGGVWEAFLGDTISNSGVQTQVVPTNGFTSPSQFLDALQRYTCKNYYSNRTAFQACYDGVAGPTSVVEDSNYFYGACVTTDSGIDVSSIAGTCHFKGNQWVRKIAHKGALYLASCLTGCDPTKADIDQTIAREQFAELGPVIAQHVAAFLQFYAPALTVTMSGTSGSGTGQVTVAPGVAPNVGSTQITCASAQSGTPSCSGLFVQTAAGAPSLTLTAAPDPGSTFIGWTENCSGTNLTTTTTLSSDQSCTATFASSTPTLEMTLPIPLQVPIPVSGGVGTGYYQINVNFPSTGPLVSLVGSGQKIIFQAQISNGFSIIGVNAALNPNDVWTDYCPTNPNANNSAVLNDVSVSSSISANGQAANIVVADQKSSCVGVVNLSVSINYAASRPN